MLFKLAVVIVRINVSKPNKKFNICLMLYTGNNESHAQIGQQFVKQNKE